MRRPLLRRAVLAIGGVFLAVAYGTAAVIEPLPG
jgi:hypothetical protein